MHGVYLHKANLKDYYLGDDVALGDDNWTEFMSIPFKYASYGQLINLTKNFFSGGTDKSIDFLRVKYGKGYCMGEGGRMDISFAYYKPWSPLRKPAGYDFTTKEWDQN